MKQVSLVLIVHGNSFIGKLKAFACFWPQASPENLITLPFLILCVILTAFVKRQGEYSRDGLSPLEWNLKIPNYAQKLSSSVPEQGRGDTKKYIWIDSLQSSPFSMRQNLKLSWWPLFIGDGNLILSTRPSGLSSKSTFLRHRVSNPQALIAMWGSIG